MFAVDLHTHTRFFHGFRASPTAFDPVGAHLLTKYGRLQGLQGVAVTNHDYQTDFDTVENGAQVIPGIEISTTAGHVLVIGPDPPSRTRPEALTPQGAVSLAHEHDCVAIIAHPFRGGSVRESGADFDAVEINGKHPGNVERVRELADALDIPVVGGSDAHFPFEAGRAFTRIDATRLTPESVVAAIREERVTPHIRDSRINRLLQTSYRYIHRYLR